MAYAVHIRRRSGPITLEEWTAAAAAIPEIAPAGEEGAVPRFSFRDAVFVWKDGEIVVDDLDDDWCKKLGEVAERLGAEAVGDDGERYLADGRVDYGDGAQTLHRVDLMAAMEIERSRSLKVSPLRKTSVQIGIAALVLAIAVGGFVLAR